jgi:hypothetical protein
LFQTNLVKYISSFHTETSHYQPKGQDKNIHPKNCSCN